MIFIRFHNNEYEVHQDGQQDHACRCCARGYAAVRLLWNRFYSWGEICSGVERKAASVLLHLLQLMEQVFQPVEPDLVHQPELLSQLARRKALVMVPHQVMLRQVTKQYILIFPVRHFMLHQAKQYFFVEDIHGRKYENQQVSRGLKFFSIFDDVL